MNIYSLFSRTSDVAEAVNGKVKFRAAANDRRANLLVVAVPHELHPQDIRKCSPLKQERKKNECSALCKLKEYFRIFIIGAYRPIEAVAVVV